MIIRMFKKSVVSLRNILKYRKRLYSTDSFLTGDTNVIIDGKTFLTDQMTNVTDRILSHVGRDLHVTPGHPLDHLRQRIINYIYNQYRSPRGSPSFSVYDRLPRVVSIGQNFDSLLVPKDHPSRHKSDNYYINENHLLRAHTSAHQSDLIKMGLNSFLVFGDVYRRDEIDRTHYPVFHQMEAVRLLTEKEVSGNPQTLGDFKLFEDGEKTQLKQSIHSTTTVRFVETDLKSCLEGLAMHLFGIGTECRWVDAYFPFTHPSWELEVCVNGDWVEMLGCGVIAHEILAHAGASDKVGWAFGLGMERWAMKLYDIPDIRLFWSMDSGFLSQFAFKDPNTVVNYKPVSQYPQCFNDISFWLPENKDFVQNDFMDIVRNIGGNIIEQVHLKDDFAHPKTGRISKCYRITYRHMERVLTQQEVNEIHQKIEETLSTTFGVTIR